MRIGRVTAVVTAALGAVLLSAGTAHAGDAEDQRFTDAVATLNIPIAEGTDVPKAGQAVCDRISAGLAANPNPVPAVRGVLGTLTSSGLTRPQAGAFLRTAVAVYCPQYRSITGR